MRFDGKLDKWNDDRGYGFIAPTRGGEPVFVHISAFPRDGRRPQLGEALTFEVEPAPEGKKRAIKVERPAAAARSRMRDAAADTRQQRSSRSYSSRRSYAGGVITALLFVGVGAFAYVQYQGARSGSAPTPSGASAAAAAQDADQLFRCDGRTHCSQMTSCAEAKFFLKNCPGTQMDGDGDGTPCEAQWCSGSWGR
jgi:cold shock CspA family protein